MDNVVLLHGFTQTGESWSEVRRLLPERYRVWAPDIRGHGQRGDEQPIDFESCCRDIELLEPDRFVLVGYSMGGRIALKYTIEHPDRVERLVLIGATPGIEDAEQREERRRADEQLAAHLDDPDVSVEQFAEEWGSSELFSTQSPEVALRACKDRLRNQPSGLARSLRGVGTGVMEPLWDRLDQLSLLVTLLVGEHDRKFREINQQMMERLPNARLEVVTGVGHAVHLEDPASVLEVLTDC